MVNSGSDGSNVPRSMNPYSPDDSLSEHRTQAVESLFPSCFAGRSGWKQKIDEFHDRGDRGGQQFWSVRVMQEHKSSFQGLIQGVRIFAGIKIPNERHTEKMSSSTPVRRRRSGGTVLSMREMMATPRSLYTTS